MNKTTVYLPVDLKHAVRRYASRRGISEAEVIRRAVADAVARDEIPRPRGGLFSSDVLMADDVDTHLEGFGQR
ncbi:MAG: ribbon-helix-helix protein, CopG family [Pseudonocardiaceae bacterium]|nr:ribbon-helix-helix protein, CopG family [Pseudonocardiaceae bacterium]